MSGERQDFDANAEASKLKELAKQWFTSAKDDSHPIEQRQALNTAEELFREEIAPLWKDPAKIQQLAEAFEKSNNSGAQHKVDIQVDGSGKIRSFDFGAIKDPTGMSLDLSSTAAEPWKMRSTFRTPNW